MRYVGGKTRIAKWVAEHVSSLTNGHNTYLEPFVGSGATFVKLAPRFQSAIAADDHADLILMWKALAAGWDPPEHVSKDEYVALRAAEPSALRGFVGFGASFSGKWFGGYVDTAWDEHWKRYTKPYLRAARASVIESRDVFYARVYPQGRLPRARPGASHARLLRPALCGDTRIRRDVAVRLGRVLGSRPAVGWARRYRRRLGVSSACRLACAGRAGAEGDAARRGQRGERNAPRGALDRRQLDLDFCARIIATWVQRMPLQSHNPNG